MIKQQFWCHICSIQFSSIGIAGTDHITCPKCHQQFTQINSKITKPSSYSPYQKIPKKYRNYSRINPQSIRLGINELSQIIQVENQNLEITDQMLEKLRFQVNVVCQCAVCKEELQIHDKALMPNCKHIFHEECLVQWLKKKNSCPICRNKILNI